MGKTRVPHFRITPQPVHPHACGENVTSYTVSANRNGTSPRVWGKLCNILTHGYTCRYIPTRVGKTTKGELVELLLDGTSPRVWGKRDKSLSIFSTTRYIPTRVGKTSPGSMPKSGTPVHPHACGENRVRLVHHAAYGGTSPRVWGKRLGFPAAINLARYIPTRVGKTPYPLSFSQVLLGTSPRVWGKLDHTYRRCPNIRYIPTRVGKTPEHMLNRGKEAVHPHACGENPC